MAIQKAALNELVRRAPERVRAIAPNDPRIPIAIAMSEFTERKGSVDKPLADAAVQALARAPMAEEPLFLAATQAVMRRDNAAALPLLEEARRRNPRSRLSRLLLLDQYLRAGRVADAASEMTVLARLLPEASKVLVPELARMAADPASQRALITVLRQDPDMHQAVLRHLATADASDALILKLAREGASGAPSEPPVWPAILLHNLVQRGDIGRAKQLWRELSATKTGDSLVYNGRFAQDSALPPFNWALDTTPAGVAEIGRKPGLQVEYYGRQKAALASQLLTLSPGSYRLELQVEGNASGEGSRLAWDVSCAGSSASLGRADLVGIGYDRKKVSIGFAVPRTGCNAQWLRLNGEPAEFPKTQNVFITNLDIRAEK